MEEKKNMVEMDMKAEGGTFRSTSEISNISNSEVLQ